MRKKRIRYYPIGKCSQCPIVNKLRNNGRCISCNQDFNVKISIKNIKINFLPLNDYNKNLFELYFTYINRYRLTYPIKDQTKNLSILLEKEKIPTIKSWFNIYCLSDTYLIYKKNSTAKGCAFIKIGKMMQELGVLPPREDEKDRQIECQLSHFPDPQKMREFSHSLLKIGTSKTTIYANLSILRNFSHWLFHSRMKKEIIEAEAVDISDYINMLVLNYNATYAKAQFHCIKRFYKWTDHKVIIDQLSSLNIKFGCPKKKINILDDHTILQLFSFIKNPRSDPEQALIITLTLIWGFKVIDLAQASISISEDHFHIKLRRKPLTKGRLYYNRDEILQLPKNPSWFLDLQRRYLKIWMGKYKTLKKTYPNTPLFFHQGENGHASNYLSTESIRRRFKLATKGATNKQIPQTIIRQTCGHLFSKTGDGSLLSTLGWSQGHSFTYTWLPRKIWFK